MKILIVDDEPGLAAGLAKWLAEGGWGNPGVAATSDEAVEWANQNGRIDVLVTNAILQPADGLTLRESLLAHMPKMKTVFLSGIDLSGHAARIEGCPVLAKPVTAETVEETIRSLYEPKPVASAPQPTAVAATPRVAATAQPTAVAATPRVAATAQPTAVAVTPRVAAAQPAAVAATPRVAATAQPTTVAATPRVAAAQPAAVAAAPQAVSPQPSTQTATPRVAAATPVPATPRAVPKPVSAQSVSTVAQVVPRPAAASATPVATAPKATARPAVASARAAVSPASEMEMEPDELVGTTIGDYLIEAKIGEGSQGGIYRATQAKMRRQVRFYTLDRTRAQDPTEIQRFIANASMKANVAHPSIFAVYEAGESHGIYFYSCEYVPCRSLRQLTEAGQLLDENTALQAMKVASEVLGYFAQQNVTHNLVSENAILIGPHDRPRIANIAVYEARESFDMPTEMARLGAVIASALPENSEALGVRELAVHLAIGQQTFPNWPALTEAVTALEPKIAPQDAYKLDAQERAAVRMVEEAKKRQKRSMIISSLVSLALLTVALTTVWWFLRPKGASIRTFDEMREIPAGEFLYQDGKKETLPTFWIDQYEVTIAQYAEFLAYLEANPGEATKFDHPKQPKGKPHVPDKWADMDIDPPMPGYYNRAIKWGRYKDAPLDVNSPVFNVDWYDAYAYANWKGRRLPTEKEWEKAARGTDGFKFPWGNEANDKNVNSGIDTNRDPKKGGEKDGHDAWSPVDAMKADKSPFGVMGMAGNVSEWTSDYDADEKMSTDKVPVIRGGNWRTPGDYTVTRRVLKLSDLQFDEALGFRTVSDTAPAKK